MLLTERLHARSTKIHFRNPMRLKKVKMGMARIKHVLGERARAYAEARAELRQVYEAAQRETKRERRMAHLQAELARLQRKTEALHTAQASQASIISGTPSDLPAEAAHDAAVKPSSPQL